MNEERHSSAPEVELISDVDELARREAENGVRQFVLTLDIIKSFVHESERPFRLRTSQILQLHYFALDGIHRFAGAFRNTPVEISSSKHRPPDHFFVPEEVEHMCSYVNENWSKSALHLAAFVLWKLNWIHPFADGNGRTSRAVSYVVLSIRLNSVLPGFPTIPDQIASDKNPYYEALEAADEVWLESKSIDVSALEDMLSGMLAKQLLNATKAASEDNWN